MNIEATACVFLDCSRQRKAALMTSPPTAPGITRLNTLPMNPSRKASRTRKGNPRARTSVYQRTNETISAVRKTAKASATSLQKWPSKGPFSASASFSLFCRMVNARRASARAESPAFSSIPRAFRPRVRPRPSSPSAAVAAIVQRVPLVDGTPSTLGSRSQAIRSERARPLKIASPMWWLFRP